MNNCAAKVEQSAAKVEQMVADTEKIQKGQRENEQAQRENEANMMIYMRELRRTNENIIRTEARLAAAAQNHTRPVLRVGASPRQSRRPETAPDPKDDEEDEN
jgi:hypothetical protein